MLLVVILVFLGVVAVPEVVRVLGGAYKVWREGAGAFYGIGALQSVQS